MAKYCPDVKRKVTYLECLECDDKVCLKSKKTNNADNLLPKDENGNTRINTQKEKETR